VVAGLATVEALGVPLDGTVTGPVGRVVLVRERADPIPSDPVGFDGFVGEQVLDGQVGGASFASVLTLAGMGSPPIPE
jgi:hypothetical protein